MKTHISVRGLTLDSDTVEGLRFIHRIREAEVEQEHQLAECRLVDVQRRLQLIEKEKHMSQIEINQKPLPAVRLAASKSVVADQPEIASVVGPAFDAVAKVIGDEPGNLETPIALYETVEEGLQVVVGYAYDGPAHLGFEIFELPSVEDAFCGIHLGSMDHIAESWQALHTEILARGFMPTGPCRELYVRAISADQSDWVTELQQPVIRA